MSLWLVTNSGDSYPQGGVTDWHLLTDDQDYARREYAILEGRGVEVHLIRLEPGEDNYDVICFTGSRPWSSEL